MFLYFWSFVLHLLLLLLSILYAENSFLTVPHQILVKFSLILQPRLRKPILFCCCSVKGNNRIYLCFLGAFFYFFQKWVFGGNCF
jgi:hypothetical protein